MLTGSFVFLLHKSPATESKFICNSNEKKLTRVMLTKIFKQFGLWVCVRILTYVSNCKNYWILKITHVFLNLMSISPFTTLKLKGFMHYSIKLSWGLILLWHQSVKLKGKPIEFMWITFFPTSTFLSDKWCLWAHFSSFQPRDVIIIKSYSCNFDRC